MEPLTDVAIPPASQYASKIVPFEPPLLRIRYPHGFYVKVIGYVDWSPYARATVELGPVDPSATTDQVRVLDVLTANEVMTRTGDPLWARSSTGVAYTPDGWLWRHVAESRRVVLVPAEVATAFRHAGGITTRWEHHTSGGLTIPGEGAGLSFVAADPVTEEDLDALAKELPGPLPESYRDLMARTGGGRPETPAVHPEFGFVLDQSFLRVSRGRKKLLDSVSYQRRWYADRFTDDFVAIIRVQGGMLALRLTGPDPGSVWFWDFDDPRDDYRYDAPVVSRDLLRRCGDSLESFVRALAPVSESLLAPAYAAVDSDQARPVYEPKSGSSLPARDRPPVREP